MPNHADFSLKCVTPKGMLNEITCLSLVISISIEMGTTSNTVNQFNLAAIKFSVLKFLNIRH